MANLCIWLRSIPRKAAFACGSVRHATRVAITRRLRAGWGRRWELETCELLALCARVSTLVSATSLVSLGPPFHPPSQLQADCIFSSGYPLAVHNPCL